MSRLGVVLHHHRGEVHDLARRVIDWAAAHDSSVALPDTDAELVGRDDLGVDEAIFGEGLDLCVSLGGDGTMLRSIHLCAPDDVPVLGVNAGHLGYLSHVDPDELEDALDEWVDGLLTVQRRMLLDIIVEGDGEPTAALALNEVVIERAEAGHTVAVEADIAGRRFTRYLADGVIVATPTGSTAYSLSAGGPIVEPDFEALLLTPVAAHMVFDRSMVLAPTTEVRLTMSGYRTGAVTVDGRTIATVEPGHAVVCRASEQKASFVIRNGPDFHTVLKQKFGLTER